jgi:hypothetical protein
MYDEIQFIFAVYTADNCMLIASSLASKSGFTARRCAVILPSLTLSGAWSCMSDIPTALSTFRSWNMDAPVK